MEQQIQEDFYHLLLMVLVEVLDQARMCLVGVEEQLVQELYDWILPVLVGLMLLVLVEVFEHLYFLVYVEVFYWPLLMLVGLMLLVPV